MQNTRSRILVVDDDAVTRLSIQKCLAHDPNIEVTTSSSGDEVLKRLTGGEQVDRLLVDWNMPGLDGYELVCAVRADPRFKHLKILMLTAETSMEHVQSALAAGADEYLMKPFTKEMLLGKLAMIEWH